MQILRKLFLLLHALSCLAIGLADPNWNTGRACTPKPANETTTTTFKTNLNALLTTLEQQAPLNNGFYNTTSGENSDRLYGLVQCRGDLSSEDCATCLKDTVQVAFNACTNSNYTMLWFRWCFLRYSDEDFFGQWQGSLSALSYGNPVTDVPSVIAKGRSLMSQLAATVMNEPLMYKTGSVDVGDGAKRYGLAQCNRDLSKSSCGECLTTQVKFFDQTIGNQSLLEIFGYGCSMWYNNYQFYYKNSVPTTGMQRNCSSKIGGNHDFTYIFI